METGTGVRVIWERDGNPIRQFDGQLQFQLLIDPVEVADQGNYACRVVLSSPHSPGEIGPISAGTLTIIGKIMMESVMYNLVVFSYRFRCHQCIQDPGCCCWVTY